jgi:hypothetical protein
VDWDTARSSRDRRRRLLDESSDSMILLQIRYRQQHSADQRPGVVDRLLVGTKTPLQSFWVQFRTGTEEAVPEHEDVSQFLNFHLRRAARRWGRATFTTTAPTNCVLRDDFVEVLLLYKTESLYASSRCCSFIRISRPFFFFLRARFRGATDAATRTF